ncbi:MAG: Sua5/YciO/YrdC/YwlC family protein [Gemmatimonadota bacterium]
MTAFEEFALPAALSASSGAEAPADRAATEEALEQALRCLSADSLLAHPTSSVFGLGGSVSLEVEAEVSRLKGYTVRRPYIRLVYSARQISTAFPSVVWNDTAERLADRFWPGPVTLVLDDGTAEGVALRAEGNRFMQLLLEAWGRGVLSSSLNRRGEPVSATRDAAAAALAALSPSDLPVTFVSEPRLPGPPASSIVSVRDGRVRVLRVGAVSVEEIGTCLSLDPRGLGAAGPAK